MAKTRLFQGIWRNERLHRIIDVQGICMPWRAIDQARCALDRRLAQLRQQRLQVFARLRAHGACDFHAVAQQDDGWP